MTPLETLALIFVICAAGTYVALTVVLHLMCLLEMVEDRREGNTEAYLEHRRRALNVWRWPAWVVVGYLHLWRPPEVPQ